MDTQTGCIPCGIRSFTRNTYFNGKPLLERDFNDEQQYLVGKNWLHNSLLHGTGTVCGLKVSPHPNEGCRDRFVTIEPGMALDCCGREIVVPQRLLVRVRDLIAENELLFDEPTDLFIALRYEESQEEPIPLLLPPCDCAGAEQGFNRVRETARVHLFTRPSGQALPARPPLDPRLDWLHTLTLDEQSPRAVAIDEQLGQLYVAAQGTNEGDGARLYLFSSETHHILSAAEAGRAPTDLALSPLGDRIYLATSALGAEGGAAIAVFQEAAFRGAGEPAATIALEEPARLVVSPRTGALMALLLESGRLLLWTDEAIQNWLAAAAPPSEGPADRREVALGADLSSEGGAGARGAAMLTVTADGRYLFVADPASGLRVVDLATLSETTPPDVEGFGVPLALRASQDSEYLYVLWQGEGEEAGHAFLSRHRIADDGGTLALPRDGRGGRWPAEALDLALAPAERFAYVLQREGGETVVAVLSVDILASTAEGGPADPRAAREVLTGVGRHQRLNGQGTRLYVAADEPATEEGAAARGLLAVLDVDEHACDARFLRAVDGCPTCGGEDEEHAVVLAHMSRFTPGRPMEEMGSASAGNNEIDNLTHRPLVPSSNTIVEVIRCMLEQGFAEGVPGPRGPAGQAGEAGARGPGVTEASATTLTPGASATATLEPIGGDAEGDFRLRLGIPTGAAGGAGPRGPGITQVAVNTLPPGSAATATLQPIAGDPEADQRLLLGIPRGTPGEVPPDEPLTQIEALSWLHDETISVQRLLEMMVDPNPFDLGAPRAETGVVIAFSAPVRTTTLFQRVRESTRSEVFHLLARFTDRATQLLMEGIVPRAMVQAVEVIATDGDGRISEVVPLPDDVPETRAVRLVFNPDTVPPLFDTESLFLRVVLRADFVLDEAGRAVDGNFLGGQLPTGNDRQGDGFESWFFVGQSDDL